MNIFRGAAVATAIAGSVLAGNAQAVNLASDGVGEVAIAPYYTARGGWITAINLTNTTDDQIVVKVRFHEALNSRDVLDFNVALSAFDQFTGVVRAATADDVNNQQGTDPNFRFAEGDPIFVSTDDDNSLGNSTCTSPQIISQHVPVGMLTQGVTGVVDAAGAQDPSADGGPGGNTNTRTAEGIDRLREGYVEFIVMGHTDFAHNGRITPAPAGNLFPRLDQAIETHNCAIVDQAFLLQNIQNTARQFGEPTNALKFNFRLLKPAEGFEAGNNATTWANFYNPGANAVDRTILPANNTTCTVTRGDERFTGVPASSNGRTQVNWVPDGSDGGASCQNLITAQESYSFLEPTLNDAFPAVANWYEDATNQFVTWTPNTANVRSATAAVEGLRGVDAFSATIQRSTLINEWANVNVLVREVTDWIITMPTKGFYVDGRDATGAALGEQFALKNPGGPFSNFDARAEARLAGTPGGATATLPYAPFDQVFGPKPATQTDPNTAMACNTVTVTPYDRAEQTPDAGSTGGTTVSPAPPPATIAAALCYEATVVDFDNGNPVDTNPSTRDSNFDEGLNRLRNTLFARTTVNTQGRQITNSDGTTLAAADKGWVFMDLAAGNNSASTVGLVGTSVRSRDLTAAGTTNATDRLAGLPVIGFALKTRRLAPGPNAPNLSRNTASSIDHGFNR